MIWVFFLVGYVYSEYVVSFVFSLIVSCDSNLSIHLKLAFSVSVFLDNYCNHLIVL